MAVNNVISHINEFDNRFRAPFIRLPPTELPINNPRLFIHPFYPDASVNKCEQYNKYVNNSSKKIRVAAAAEGIEGKESRGKVGRVPTS